MSRAAVLRRVMLPAFWSQDPVRLGAAALAAGGAWPRIVQWISMRYDLFTPVFCDALSSMQTRSVGETKVASVGVVSKLGSVVAHKEIIPGRRDEVAEDLVLFRRLARTTWWVPVLRRLRLYEMVEELDLIFKEDLNLLYEAEGQRLGRRFFKKHGISVPAIYSASPTHIDMEFVVGKTLTELLEEPTLDKWLVDNGLGSRAQVGERIVESTLRAMFEDNIFHRDLHAGNVMLTYGRIWFIDFAAYGRVEIRFLEMFFRFFSELVTRQYVRAANRYTYLCRGLTSNGLMRFFSNKRMARCRRALALVMERWVRDAETPGLPYRLRSFDACTQGLMRVIARFGGTMEPAWTRIYSAISAVTGLLAKLHPDVSFIKVARKYLKDATRRVTLEPLNPAILMNVAARALLNIGERIELNADKSLAEALLEGR